MFQRRSGVGWFACFLAVIVTAWSVGCAGESAGPAKGPPPPTVPQAGYQRLGAWRDASKTAWPKFALSPDGRFAAYGSAADGMDVIDLVGWKKVFHVKPKEEAKDAGFAFSADGKALAHVHGKGVRAYAVPTWALLTSADAPKALDKYVHIAAVPTTREFLIEANQNRYLWSPDRPRAFTDVSDWDGGRFVLFPDGKRLLDKIPIPGRLHSYAEVVPLRGPRKPKRPFGQGIDMLMPAVSPKGDLIACATGRYGHRLHLWEVADIPEAEGPTLGDTSKVIPLPEYLSKVAFLPGGDHLLAWGGSDDKGCVAFVDVRARRVLARADLPWGLHDLVPLHGAPAVAPVVAILTLEDDAYVLALLRFDLVGIVTPKP